VDRTNIVFPGADKDFTPQSELPETKRKGASTPAPEVFAK
jgi:hypothetical protein